MIIKEEVNKIVKREIGREIVLDIGGARFLEIYKFSNADDSAEEYAGGWEWDSDESRKIFEALSEDEQEQIEDYIEDINL